MASLRELRKHLKSIQITEQLAGAMKTVSAAKFSQINAVLESYRPYADACRSLAGRFGSALAEVLPCRNPDAPVCYAVIASNRSLCGGYNIELLEYADGLLAAETRPCTLIACGKMAIAHFAKGQAAREFVFPDVPNYGACMNFCDYLRNAYANGEFSAVYLVYQKFVNRLTQTPAAYRLFPMENAEESSGSAELPLDDTLYIPDKATVLQTACHNFVNSTLYFILTEAAAGAQAATLMAMRSAYDNAQESAANLETQISRKRQSEVTAGVIETSSDNNSMNNTP